MSLECLGVDACRLHGPEHPFGEGGGSHILVRLGGGDEEVAELVALCLGKIVSPVLGPAHSCVSNGS